MYGCGINNTICSIEKTDNDYSGITFPGGHVELGEYMVLFYKTNTFEEILSSFEEGEVRRGELEEMRKINLADGMDKIL